MFHEHEKWMSSINRIQLMVCKEFGVELIELKSVRRSKPLIPARHVAMWLCRKLTMASSTAIGIAFGDRDHSTVLYAVRNADALMAWDSELRERTEGILKEWNHEKATK